MGPAEKHTSSIQIYSTLALRQQRGNHTVKSTQIPGHRLTSYSSQFPNGQRLARAWRGLFRDGRAVLADRLGGLEVGG